MSISLDVTNLSLDITNVSQDVTNISLDVKNVSLDVTNVWGHGNEHLWSFGGKSSNDIWQVSEAQTKQSWVHLNFRDGNGFMDFREFLIATHLSVSTICIATHYNNDFALQVQVCTC